MVTRAGEIKVSVDTKGFNGLVAHFKAIGGNIKPAIARALNHTGGIARTRLIRALSKQVGLKQAVIRATLRTLNAFPGRLVFRITSRGGYISLKEFRARQTRDGVSAAPWNKRRVFPRTFIVPSLGGHVFERVSKARHPIRKLWGPAIPAELVKDQSKEAFETVAKIEFPARVAYEIGAILGGVVRQG